MDIRPVGAAPIHADGRTDRETDKHDKRNRRVLRLRNTHKTEEDRKVSSSYLKEKIKKRICFVWHMRATKPLDIYLGQILKYSACFLLTHSLP